MGVLRTALRLRLRLYGGVKNCIAVAAAVVRGNDNRNAVAVTVI